MGVFEQERIHEAPERLPELPADVKIPDDLSGLEPRRVVDRSRPATAIRWLRWLPLVLLFAFGAIVVGLELTGDTAETIAPSAVPWSEGQGPDSNSLNVPAGTPSVITAPSVGPWSANDGPGSNSLNDASARVSPWSGNDGPGSNSLNTTLGTSGVSPWAVNQGPGSNSLTT